MYNIAISMALEGYITGLIDHEPVFEHLLLRSKLLRSVDKFSITISSTTP